MEYQDVVSEVESLTDRLGMPLDPGIKKVVIALRYCGIDTYMSCEGHMERALPYPWVAIGAPSKEHNLFLQGAIEAFLNSFYHDREKNLCALQIVPAGYNNEFRLQSLNQIGCREDTETMIRDQVILSALRKEMDDFADYLVGLP